MTNRVNKLRLDQLLVKKNLAASREKARGLILSGKVKIGNEVVSKAGRLFPEDSSLQILSDPHPYVSRGGVKLEHALCEWHEGYKNYFECRLQRASIYSGRGRQPCAIKLSAR